MKCSIKYSIKSQMLAVFVGVIGFLLVSVVMINMKFLESYYIQNKRTAFVGFYNELEYAMDEGSLESIEVSEEIHQMAEKNNLSYLIINEDNSKALTNVHDMNGLDKQLTGHLLNQKPLDYKLLEKTDNYEITQSKDRWSYTDYIEMWGVFDEGGHFMVRSPLESIKESAQISNRFLIYIGFSMIILCALLIEFFSKRLTDPILELVELSKRMADQDFEAKYTSGGKNEIGVLGENFNRMSEKLEQAIAGLKQANNQLQKDLEQKEKLDEMRNEFLGNVSHELKTPIALIQGYAEGLKEEVNEDAESRQFYCDVIMDEAGKMNQMVKNLLTLNQLEFGDEEVVFERFDLTQLVEGVLKSMEILAKQNEVSVIFRERSPVFVWADEFKVEQVIRNYVSNAFHHVNKERVVEVKILAAGEKARVTVFNTGTPIPQEDLGKIWDKFYKVDKAHTREYGGNGIGLSIVKAIMESFHQRYGVENYDNGVEFWFELDVK